MVTFGAMTSLADSDGILGAEGVKSSANLSALMNRRKNRMREGQRTSDFCST